MTTLSMGGPSGGHFKHLNTDTNRWCGKWKTGELSLIPRPQDHNHSGRLGIIPVQLTWVTLRVQRTKEEEEEEEV